MPSGTPSTTRRPFTDSDDRALVEFLAVHHPSKEGRMGNAVYKLLTEQPKKWPWGKRHTWMSWRERYKNHEARFDHHIKAFQHKNKLSRRAVPMGFEAMLMNGMEDLNDFGTDDEEEEQRPQGKRAARVDSDTDDEYEEPARARSGPANKAATTSKQPISKRKRVSDTNDRTSKRSKVDEADVNDELQGGNSTDSPTGKKEGDVMDQDSQGEEILEVEQNLFYPSDEDSLIVLRPHSKSKGESTPTRPAQLPRSGGPVASASNTHDTPRTRQPVHRPHSPKNPPSSPFSTIDVEESGKDSPIVPKPARKRTIPKIVESAFGRNEQYVPFRSSQIRADSPSEFDLLVERRAARKAEASKHLESSSTGEDLRERPRGVPELGLSSTPTSKRGSVEPCDSSPSSQPTPRLRPRPTLSTTIDATEKRMIEAREELSKLALRFRDRFPRSPLGLKPPSAGMTGDKTHPFDESTHPFDETTHPFDETTRPFDDSQNQTQEPHPFDESSRAPSQELHPFDESTQQPPDSILDSQSPHRGLEVGAPDVPMRDSPLPPTPGTSKRQADALLTASLLESRKPRIAPIDRLRPGSLSSPNNPPRSPQDLTPKELAAPDSSSRRLKVSTPTTTSRSALRTPRSPVEDAPILSPRRSRAGGVSPEQGRPRSMATQELRELLENSPRTRRTTTNLEAHPPTNEKPPQTSERKLTHKTRFSEPSVKPETATPGHHMRTRSTANDDPFSSPTALRLSSPHPQVGATILDAEQESPLALHTTSQSGLDATIKSRQTRREAAQDRNRRVYDSERPDSLRSIEPTTVVATLRKGKGTVEAPVQADMEEDVDAVDESQTYDIEHNPYDVNGTPMMDLSFRPPRRIPPTYRAPLHTRHRTSSPTVNSRDYGHEHEHDGGGRKPSRNREREAERSAQDDREQRRDPRRLSGVSFGSPVAASSPPRVRRNGHGQSYDRQDLNTSFSSRISGGSTASTTSTAMGIMTGPLSLGFAPSEMDAYLGIQVACEKIAKTHGFQVDAVFRVYQEVKDLRKAEEIVIGMKRAAEKDAIERIMKVREKTERKKMGERSVEGSSHWERDGDQSRASRQSYDVRDEDEDEDEEGTDRSIIYEEGEGDLDSEMRVEHLSKRNKRPSTSSTLALRQRGGYDRPRTSTTTIGKARERDQVRSREGSAEYYPPTPTRANLWKRLSKSGKHPESALLGESTRASLGMPRYEVVNHE